MELIIEALAKAVDYESANLDKSSYDNDQSYWTALGYTYGLGCALYLAQELEKGTDIETALRMAVDMEDE